MLDMKSKAACFTGHRTLPEENLPEIAERLENALIALIEQDYCYFSAGGALGFDTLAAQTVLRLRERYPQIRLILVLPCRSQTRGWSQADIDIYEEIKRRADKVTYTSENYFRGCIQKRNRHLVDNSSICICYLTKPTGGTAYTVNYARRCSLQILNIAQSQYAALRRSHTFSQTVCPAADGPGLFHRDDASIRHLLPYYGKICLDSIAIFEGLW